MSMETEQHQICPIQSCNYYDQGLFLLLVLLQSTTSTATPTSGLKHLSEEARVRATDKKASKFEKVR
jgi:hypothetical protein